MDKPDVGVHARRFRMRERLIDIGEDFLVEDERGEPVYRVDGKVLTLRRTFVLEDTGGHVLARIREPLLSLRETVVIERPGRPAATVKRALLSPLRARFHVELDGDELDVVGDIIGHEYSILRDSTQIARISRSWFSLVDSYGIQVEPGEDAPLAIAIAVAIEAFDPGE
jgi:uncharacterized protein YxjI